jgi:lysophospholipase L1-like esterase
MPFSRYVALGDSTTEGLDDPGPGGTYVGFADRLAARIARENPDLLYANLAIRGRKAWQIHGEQLGPAVAMRPDLATVVGGLNDILRPKVELADVAGHLEAVTKGLRESGATVVGMTYPDPCAIMPIAKPIRPRVLELNEALRGIARRHGMVLVDAERDGIVDARLWSVDRLHANAAGHERIAGAIAHSLGLQVDEDPWLPLPPADPVHRAIAVGREIAWVARYMTPWIMRRIRGRSSGDGILPKRPQLTPIAAADRG